MQYGKNKYGREGNINVHYETHGKEYYPCIVKESKDMKNGKHAISYDCHKFNPERTMAKGVVISLTYNHVSASQAKEFCKRRLFECQEQKNTLPARIKKCNEVKISCSTENLKIKQELVKEYTYEDLQKRSQRILDSLYIKDGWEK